MTSTFPADPCPCGLRAAYADCCGRFHEGVAAPDAERLMRSRYAAYVRHRTDYLLATWHSSTRPATLDLDETPAPKWLGLEVKHSDSKGDRATVEFVARYRIGGRATRLHETSRFACEAGRWYYVDGDLHGTGR